MTKTWYAKKIDVDPRKIVCVAIMPCTAKKYEAARPEMGPGAFHDVDYVLTTRELARMIRRIGLDFKNLPDEPYDEPFDQYSGAAMLFGATGGVLEAAIRTAYKLVNNKEMPVPDFEDARGESGLKYGSVQLGEHRITIAVAHGTGNARRALDRFKSGERKFDYMEVMACPADVSEAEDSRYWAHATTKNYPLITATTAPIHYTTLTEAKKFGVPMKTPVCNRSIRSFCSIPCRHCQRSICIRPT